MRLDHPAVYEADPHWLEEVRSAEPTTEILYVGDVDLGTEVVPGVWIAGSVAEHPSPEALAFDVDQAHARAVRQGFRPIEWYEWQDFLSGAAFLDFKIRNWKYYNALRFQRELVIAEGTGDKERLERAQNRIAYVQAEHKSIHDHCFRGRRGVVIDGINLRKGGTNGSR